VIDPHDEIVGALRAVGNPRLGLHVAKDRGSGLEYLGVRMPALRRIARGPLGFTDAPEDEVLATWDRLWRESPYGEVLFAALEFYLPLARRGPRSELWPVVRGWIERVDNWAHADGLANLYSHLLERQQAAVYPTLQAWNSDDDEWRRRISLVSLIHYSGKNAVFLEPALMLPLVANCLGDDRYYVQKAVGWVLRELSGADLDAATTFIEEHLDTLGSIAFARAVERLGAGERAVLRERRRGLRGSSTPR